MHFISILIVLAILQTRRVWLASVQNDEWFFSLWAKHGQSSAVTQFVFAIVLPVAVLTVITILARSVLWGVFDLLLSVGVLMYALGRGHYISLYRAYKKAVEAGDNAQVVDVLVQLDQSFSAPADDVCQLHCAARKLFIYQSFTRLFVVLFWFSLLGPVAAFFYRLVKLAASQENNRLIPKVEHVMEWPVARLFAFSVSLLGNFSAGFARAKALFLDSQKSSEDVICEVSLAALDQELCWPSYMVFENDHAVIASKATDEIDNIHQLIHRSTIFAVVIIAIFHVVF